MRIWANIAAGLAAFSCSSLWIGNTNMVEAKSATGDRLLVVLPKTNDATTGQYSWLLDTLTARGFDVSVQAATSHSVSLFDYGQALYDHAIILAPAVNELGKKLSHYDLIHFVEMGGNLVVGGSNQQGEWVKKLGTRFGIVFEDSRSQVIDYVHHFKNDKAVVAGKVPAGTPSAILSSSLTNSSTVYFKGIGHKYDTNSPLMVPVLTGLRTGYSQSSKAKSKSKDPAAPLSGSSLGLVTAFQTRNNARVVFSGSTSIFSDKLVRQTASSNKQFAAEILQWGLQEKSVLKKVSHSHYLESTGDKPEHYRINDKIVYEVDLSVYYDGAWHPYKADDVQFEATMLDPYIRTTLNRTSAATYRGDIKLPDRYGTFTFRVNYKRTGYSNVDIKDTVGIWPLRHDEYPRFLTAAYPYYTGSLVMVIGFLALCAVWLWTAEPAGGSKNKKKKQTTAKTTNKPKSN